MHTARRHNVFVTFLIHVHPTTLFHSLHAQIVEENNQLYAVDYTRDGDKFAAAGKDYAVLNRYM